jgi:hypothetical protein
LAKLDDLAGVSNAFALIRIGLANFANVSSDLADLLFVDP